MELLTNIYVGVFFMCVCVKITHVMLGKGMNAP